MIYLPYDPNPKVPSESSIIDLDSFLHGFQSGPVMLLLTLFYLLTFYTYGIAFY